MGDSGQRTAYRLRIAGIKDSWVTDSRLVGTDSDGHSYKTGLQRKGIRIEEEVALPQMEYESSGMTVTIVESERGNEVAKALFKRPSETIWLDSDADPGDTAIAVRANGTLFSAGDYAWIGPECVKVTGSSSGALGVERGQLGTTAVKHYATTEKDGTPINVGIHDAPPGIQGRPAEIYRYVEGTDSITAGAKGTLIWRGRCSTAARRDADGLTWHITLDPVWSSLKFSLGEEFEGTDSPRGIYYPANARFWVWIADGLEFGNSGNASFVRRSYSGHWENNAEFASYINDDLASVISNVSSIASVTLKATDNGGWTFEAHTAAGYDEATWFMIRMGSPADGALVYNSIRAVNGAPSADSDVDPDDVVGAPRGIPRGMLGDWALEDAVVRGNNEFPEANRPDQYDHVRKDGVTYQPDRIYIAADANAITTNDSVNVTFLDQEVRTQVRETDADADYVRIAQGLSAGTYKGVDDLDLQFFRRVAQGNLADLRDEIVDNSPEQVGLGAYPLLTDADIADWSDVINTRVQEHTEILGNRFYSITSSGDVDFEELLTEELKLYAVYPGLNSSGAVRLNRLQLPTQAGAADLVIDSDDILVSHSWPSIESVGDGITNSVTHKTGWNVREEEHQGFTYKTRNRSGVSEAGGQIQELKVEPMSKAATVIGRRGVGRIQTPPKEYAALAHRILGIFGRTYYTVTFAVFEDKYDKALIGNTITFSSNHLPDPDTGDLGISGRKGFIVGRDWDPQRGVINVKAILVGKPQYGYTPSVTFPGSSVSAVTGTTYRFQVTTMDPFGGVNMFPSGLGIEDVFSVGDKVETERVGNPGARSVGEIVAINAATQVGTVDVQYSAGKIWSGPYFLGYPSANTGGLTSAQVAVMQQYAYVADPDGDIAFTGATNTTNNYRTYST